MEQRPRDSVSFKTRADILIKTSPRHLIQFLSAEICADPRASAAQPTSAPPNRQSSHFNARLHMVVAYMELPPRVADPLAGSKTGHQWIAWQRRDL